MFKKLKNWLLGKRNFPDGAIESEVRTFTSAITFTSEYEFTVEDFESIISDWDFDEHTLKNPERTYEIWIANGRRYLRDYHDRFPFIKVLSRVEIDRFWKAFSMVLKKQKNKTKEQFENNKSNYRKKIRSLIKK